MQRGRDQQIRQFGVLVQQVVGKQPGKHRAQLQMVFVFEPVQQVIHRRLPQQRRNRGGKRARTALAGSAYPRLGQADGTAATGRLIVRQVLQTGTAQGIITRRCPT